MLQRSSSFQEENEENSQIFIIQSLQQFYSNKQVQHTLIRNTPMVQAEPEYLYDYNSPIQKSSATLVIMDSIIQIAYLGKPQNIQRNKRKNQYQQVKNPKEMSFRKNLISFFLNEYKQHLQSQEKQLFAENRSEELSILKQLHSMHLKYSITDMQELIKNQNFAPLFSTFLNSDQLKTRIKNNTQLHCNENYLKAIDFMIDELNSKHPFDNFFSHNKNLDQYGFIYLDSHVHWQGQTIEQEQS